MMVKSLSYLLVACLAFAAAAAPVSRAAEPVQPAVVLSVKPIEGIFKDVAYLSEAAGQPDMGRLLVILSAGYTVGIDKSKPAGAYLTFEGTNPIPVTFIPVTDLKKALATHRATLGEAKDVGEGVLELETDRATVYIKENNGYAFISQEQEYLQTLPKDVGKLLGDLPTDYTVAVQLSMQNIPADLRKVAITEMRASFERELEKQADEDEDEELADLREKIGRNTIEQFVELIDDSDQITLGWAVDPAAKVTYLDIVATALPGTELAKQLARQENQTTRFGGFLQEQSAVNMNMTGKMSDEDKDQFIFLLKTARERALKEVDDDDDLDSDKERDEAKRIVGELFDVMQASLKTGRIDGGAVLLLDDDTLRFAAGTQLAQGKKLETAIKDLVKLAQGDPEFPKAELNVGKHAGVTFHRLMIDIPEDEDDARDVFGEKLEVVIGLSDNSLYLSMGPGGMDLIKRVIDKSASTANDTVSPLRMTASIGQILEFASQFDDSPFLEGAIEALDEVRNRDHVIITSTPIKRGSKTRIEIESGVITILGRGAEAQNAARGGGF